MTRTRQPGRGRGDSLRRELRRTYLGIALFAAVIVAASLLVMATVVLRSYASQNLQLVARSISYTVEAAVVFHDDMAAREAVEQAAAGGGIAEIDVTYDGGRIAAHWREDGGFRGEWLARLCAWALLPRQVVVPVRHDRVILGEVRVVGDGHRLLLYLAAWGLGMLGCLVVSTAGALYLAHRMLRDIDIPLRNLARVAHGARARRELWRRVPWARITELRSLGEDFNGLMAELEAWEHHVRHENALLSYQAQHDKLTGVYNRAQFERVLDGLLATDKASPVAFGLLFIDCDDFKRINDGYGHHAGDQALIHVSGLIRAHARELDVVARLGGDEFCVLLPPPYLPGEAAHLATKLLQLSEVPMELPAGESLQVSFSIGIAEYPTDGADAPALMSHADIDMYHHKRGRADFAV
ncbi:diguanylate cyclase domain-containing protein [Frateuria aurantia]